MDMFQFETWNNKLGHGELTKSDATVWLKVSWVLISFIKFDNTTCCGVKVKVRRSILSTTFSSVIANFCPMQLRAPAENGMKLKGWRLLSCKNLSGLNVFGSWKCAGSICMKYVTLNIEELGSTKNFSFLMVKYWPVGWARNHSWTGGRIRSASFIHASKYFNSRKWSIVGLRLVWTESNLWLMNLHYWSLSKA